MKKILLFLFIANVQTLFCQNLSKLRLTKDFDYCYCDSANNELVYGFYEPKDILKLSDGSLLIGTEFSISFPSMLNENTPDSVSIKLLEEKFHISSGSVFKLDSSFKKEWEIIFKERRVKKIFLTSDNYALIIGEETSMKYIWMAKISLQGDLLWEKEILHGRRLTIGDVIMNEKDELFLLVASSNLIPVEIKKYGSRVRMNFFNLSEVKANLRLVKVNHKGKKKWVRNVENSKDWDKNGQRLLLSENSIFVSYSMAGFVDDKHVNQQKITIFSKEGNKLSTINDFERELLTYQEGLISVTSYSEETLFLYKENQKIDSISIKSPRKDVRILKMISSNNTFLILGSNYEKNRDYLLINLTPNLEFNGYTTFPKEDYQKIKGAVILDSGEIAIIGKNFRTVQARMKINGKEIYSQMVNCINLIIIEDGA